jgi:toxin-antitoxin system, antitoxin component, hicB family|nr:MAG TPA: HicB-like antitoxin [Caudoviricetes sp.]
MKKYVYPAVFTEEDNGMYSVNFKDLESCYTCGDDIDDAILNAQDVLSMVLYRYEKNGITIPKPSNIANIEINNKSFVSYVVGDTDTYRRMHNNKAVKKTLTIPEWMNEVAIAQNINFSQVLQDALMEIIEKE